ncbi:MAG: tetratricopeptide repeat protein [Chitinophagales bacterium]|jgi:tetratricopeptide (TPR) repeat protein|nr:tetratricopeptide repeat protein [Chitinophagales bacterium]HPW85541.1 tetratricopeptide repeat protein [Chitinophagales bacterium]HQO31441.1 tetratricopeptide repeat protein [Chitinophagales bacterium]
MHTIRIERLKQIIVDNPNDTFALFALAKEYEKLGDWGDAAQLLEKLLVIDSGYLGAYYHLGKIYEQLAEVKKALNIYEAGIRQAQAQQDLHTVGELRNARMNLELEL